MASEPAAPDWYSHGLNRVAYYRLATVVAAALPRAFCAMVPGGRYRVEIDPPIWVKLGEEQAGLTTVVAALERVIRADPTRWFNFFDAWSPVGGPA